MANELTRAEVKLLGNIGCDTRLPSLSELYVELGCFHRSLDKTGSRKGRRDLMRTIDRIEVIIGKIKQLPCQPEGMERSK